MALNRTTPYLLAGSGVAMCFRAGVINIGAEGQIAVGGIGAAAAALAWPGDAPLLAVAAALLGGAAAGAVWAGLATAIHLGRRVHEVLATLLLNFVALLLVQQVLAGPLGQFGAGFLQSPLLPRAAWLPRLPGLDAHAGFLIALVAAAACPFVLWRTRFGFRAARRRQLPAGGGLCRVLAAAPYLGRDAAGRRARGAGRRHRGARRASPADRGLLARLRLQGGDGRAARRAGAAGGGAGVAVRRPARGRIAVDAAADRRALGAGRGDRGADHAVRAGGDGAPRMIEFLAAAIRIATPLLLAALGGILSERAGVFAVGLEGMMLAGAFAAVVGAWATGSAARRHSAWRWSAVRRSGSSVAMVAVRYRADNMVTGLTANILALGLTSYLLRVLAGGGRPVAIHLTPLAAWPIPGLADLPVLGPLLFEQPPLTYLAVLGCSRSRCFLGRTQAGLTLRATGENPEAVFAAGADPLRVRMLAVVACGAIAGLGGAVLSLQQVGTFTDGMTGGRGYLALASLIVGRWTPWGGGGGLPGVRRGGGVRIAPAELRRAGQLLHRADGALSDRAGRAGGSGPFLADCRPRSGSRCNSD